MYTLILTFCLNNVCYMQPIGRYASAEKCYSESRVIVSKTGGLTCISSDTEHENRVFVSIKTMF